MKPLVSVICVCYNHERFVLEALESVKAQTYSPVEMIVVDDGSVDKSASIIGQWIGALPGVQFLNLKTNHGYCVAFNKALALAKGEFIIDLAADDLLCPERISEGVEGFLANGEKYGVQFSDALYINTEGLTVRKHSDKFPHQSVPQGAVYTALIHRYFICSPTMLIRKSILDMMGGYDDRLTYEDFDLWIRASREYLFFYIPKILVQKRIVPNSMSNQQYTRNSKQMGSTFLVCKKIFALNRTSEEKTALNKRIGYELKWNLRFMHLALVGQYLLLWVRNNFFNRT